MNQKIIEDIYFSEIKKSTYDAIKGSIVFEILCKNNKSATITLTDVSNLLFIQSDEIEFNTDIAFFPIEDIIFEKGSFLSKENYKEFTYNVIIDSCLSTWYIFAKKFVICNQAEETYVIEMD